MEVRYPRHMVHTRQQAVWQNALLLLILLVSVIPRVPAQRPPVALGMVLLTLSPFMLAYRSWRFLAEQERVHEQPTPEMDFIFRSLYATPLTFGALLLIVLTGMR